MMIMVMIVGVKRPLSNFSSISGETHFVDFRQKLVIDFIQGCKLGSMKKSEIMFNDFSDNLDPS